MDIIREGWWGNGLLSAAYDGDIEKMEKLLSQEETNLSSWTGNCNEEEARKRRRLVAVNNQNEDGYATVHFAVDGMHLSMMNYLDNEGANWNVKCRYGNTCLHTALHKCQPDIVRELLCLGCDANSTNSNGLTALEAAEKEQHQNNSALEEHNKSLSRVIQHYGRIMNDLNRARETAISDICTQNQIIIEEQSRNSGGKYPREYLPYRMPVPSEFVRNLELELTLKQKTLKAVEVEIEDMETERFESLRPHKEKVSRIDSRNLCLERVISLIKNGGIDIQTNLSKSSKCDQNSNIDDSEQDDIHPETQSLKLFSDSLFESVCGESNTITLSEFKDLSIKIINDDCTLQLSPNPLQDVQRLIDQLGLSDHSYITKDVFCILVLQLKR